MKNFVYTTASPAPVNPPHSLLTSEIELVQKSIEVARNALCSLGAKLGPIMVPGKGPDSAIATNDASHEAPLVGALRRIQVEIAEIARSIESITESVAL